MLDVIVSSGPRNLNKRFIGRRFLVSILLPRIGINPSLMNYLEFIMKTIVSIM